MRFRQSCLKSYLIWHPQIVLSVKSLPTTLERLKNYLIEEIKKEFTTFPNQETLDQQTLTTVIKDWCNSLEPSIFSQIFPNGTNRCLALFSSITNNEEDFIEQLAKLISGFRIEDWNDKSVVTFSIIVKEY